MKAIRERIKAITAPRHRLPEAVKPIVDEVNRVLRGWGAYFRVGNSGEKFGQVDSHVRERLGLFLSKKAGRSGRRWGKFGLEFFQKLGLHQLAGTVSWHKAAPTAAR
jgi:hypothetical protein